MFSFLILQFYSLSLYCCFFYLSQYIFITKINYQQLLSTKSIMYYVWDQISDWLNTQDLKQFESLYNLQVPIQLSRIEGAINYILLYLMLKVHSLFPNHTLHRQTGIQTQSPIKYPQLNYTTQVFKNRKLRDTLKESDISPTQNIHNNHKYSMTSSCTPSDFQHFTQMRNFRINKRQNGNGRCDFKRKIQATKFNFIKFEDRVLNQAIKKYIKRIPLTKRQSKELQKQITIHYQLRQQSPSQELFSNPWRSQQEEKHELKTSIREVIQHITALSQKRKDPKKYYEQVESKRIEWKIQKLIASKQPIMIPRKVGIREVTLQAIIRSYMDNGQEYNLKPIFNKKGYLQRFYEQVFMRYENIPFSQQTENQNSLSPSEKDVLSLSLKNYRSSIRPSGRQSKLNKLLPPHNFCSAQKISAFENNLRKQMKNLADQSERILIDQNRKVNKF